MLSRAEIAEQVSKNGQKTLTQIERVEEVDDPRIARLPDRHR